MISESDARQMVADRVMPLPPLAVPLGEALGRVLANDVISDIDSPPHDKALVDGYAVMSSDFTSADNGSNLSSGRPSSEGPNLSSGRPSSEGPNLSSGRPSSEGPNLSSGRPSSEGSVTTLRVLEEVTAGRNPTQSLTSGSAIRIMTGAPLPGGCDAVIMIEQSTLDGDQVALKGTAAPGQHLMRRATSMKQGDVVARAGRILRAVEIGVLAEVGVTQPQVATQPSVAVLSTGDELVPTSQQPGAGQIRNSNGPMLAAQVQQAGGLPVPLGIAGDEPEVLRNLIEQGLESHVLVLSGGVSAGVLDLVPPTLKQCGVGEVFHKVLIKPGKPIWFGVAPSGTLVFGLPGNPVGSLVCFERFVKPALHQLQGREDAFGDDSFPARLTESFSHRGPRPTYRPARVDDSSHHVTPLAWHGSADLRTLADANCLIAFPPGDATHDENSEVRCVWL